MEAVAYFGKEIEEMGSNANETPEGPGSSVDVASALGELRDALVDLSLSMQDLIFEVDFIRRGEAKEMFVKLIDKK